MPVRVTIEIIPYGNENKKHTIATVDIVNNLKGTDTKGNYDINSIVYNQDGTADKHFYGNLKGIKRGNILYTVYRCLKALL
jgi:hypothetical protein